MKTIHLPFKVPNGDYCWEHFGKYEICGHFDNTGGHASCDIGFHDQKDDPKGVLKDPKCTDACEVCRLGA